MAFSDEFKHEMKNIMKDVEREVDKKWEIEYKGHRIEVINQLKEEKLLIDGVLVDRHKRKYFLSHLIPYIKLSGKLVLQDGIKHKVSVKIGGYMGFHCTVKVDNEIILDESTKLQFLPWEHKERIVPFIEQQIHNEQKIVEATLPDDSYLYNQSELRLAPGLADLLANDYPVPFHAKKLVKCFEEQVQNPNLKTRKLTYEKIIYDSISCYRDEIIERLQQSELDKSLIQDEALWLLEHAAHRDVVKFALLALGYTNCEELKEKIYTIGLHEEFTFYAVFSLKKGTSGANKQIWRLAQSVQGWGKIAAVKQLEAPTEEIKHWLLTEGPKNNVMYDYLAYPCAVNGELDLALHEEIISKELYDGAGLIILGLLSRATDPNIEEYPYAGEVLARFVYHAQKHCKTMDDFYPLMKISEFLDEVEENEEEDVSFNGYQFIHSIREMLKPIINNPNWPKLAVESLKHDYNHKAREVAHFYDIDITEQLFAWLEKFPVEEELYSAIMNTNDQIYIERLCAFVEANFSLSGLSEKEEECLQYIVQDLGEYDGVGQLLIQAALESNKASLQYHGLLVLHEWSPIYAQKPVIQDLLKSIARTTKDKEDRQLAKDLLKK